jgi:energy-coupling factor transporter ATP-binding protein EcfA2
MRKINRDHGTTFVFSTHDPRVLEIADRRVDLEDGVITRLGVRTGDEWNYAIDRTWGSVSAPTNGERGPGTRESTLSKLTSALGPPSDRK